MTKSKKSKIGSLIKFEKAFADNMVVGLDEAGRGPGAGDVFAAAVYYPQMTPKLKKALSLLDDSKKLSPKVREDLAIVIKENSIWACARGTIEEIEKINILQASLLAMKRAALQVIEKAEQDTAPFLLIDGNKLIPNLDLQQKFVVKGDSLSLSIASASIIAKTERDHYMQTLSEKHPEYDWEHNKGYLTPKHLLAIAKYGITEFHRKSFLTKQLKLKLK